MIRAVTLRGIAARARRATLTALIVAAGVATITGTLVFTDTIHGAYRQLLAGGARGAAVVVSGRAQITSDPSSAASIPQGLVRRIARLPGVARAAGQITDLATIVGRGGAVLGSDRLPTTALSYLPAPFTGLRIVAGAAPAGPREVAIDQGTAADQRLRVGDTIRVLTGQPVRRFRVSGIATLGPARIGGERFAVFSLPAAQALYDKAGTVDQIDVAAQPRASPARIAREIAPLLGPALTVHTRAGQVDLEAARVSARLAPLDGGLLAFAIVAAAVGALVILNTFAVTATDRARELSVLRVLGATRGQVLRVSLLESVGVGLAGSLLGVLAGPLAALAIRGVFSAANVGLPAGGLVLHARAGLIGFGTGIAAVLAASLVPAARATRASPLAALRSQISPPRPRRSDRLRTSVAAGLCAGGLLVTLAGTGARSERLRTSAVGGALLLVAALIVSPVAVRAVARVAGTLHRRDGVFTLAREQAIRAPGRAAVSASVLMVGIALVLLLSTYTAGLRAATRDAIHASLTGDLAIENADGTSPIPAASVQAVAAVPGLVGLASVRVAQARLGAAGDVAVNAVEPTTWPSVYRFQWQHGSAAVLAGLAAGQVLVEADTARAAGVRAGDRVTLVTGAGQRAGAVVAGVYRDAGLLRGVTVAASWFDRLFHQPRLRAVFLRLGPGAKPADALALLAGRLAAFPGVVARSEPALAAQAENDVAGVVGLFYALLALSLVMSLVGIGGTLSLSVHERTRELGLLRAVGMTAEQARALVRDESLLAAGVGSLGGVVLGLVLGWAVDRALAPEGFVFSVPWLALGLSVVVGGLAGTLAALPPARRVGRLDVLEAIAHE